VVEIERKMIDDLVRELFIRLEPERLMGERITVSEDGLDIRDIDGKRITIPLVPGEEISLIAMGKAAIPMTIFMHEILHEKGVSFSPSSVAMVPSGYSLESFQWKMEGNHPVPDRLDMENMEQLISMISTIERGKKIILLLSGGASSLTFHPRKGLVPEVKSRIISDLIDHGADIESLNTVRTYLSDIKGGGLLCCAQDAKWWTIVLSDVPGDDPRYIGSGPTYPWEPDRHKVKRILNELSVETKDSLMDEFAESERTLCDPAAVQSSVHIFANNRTVVDIAADLLMKAGFKPAKRGKTFEGIAREVAEILVKEGRQVLRSGDNDCFIAGGENTVVVKGNGKGGRNSEMTASIFGKLEKGEIAICIATDGMDGIWNGAGGWTCYGDDDDNVSFLMSNDTGIFLLERDRAIITGPSGNNLGDLFILLHRE
jgi:hydroxypyruvate reductase